MLFIQLLHYNSVFMNYPTPLQKLIAFLRKFPGVGKKTAERFAFQIISWKDLDLASFAELLKSIKKDLITCHTCKGLYDKARCPFCDPETRDCNLICIVASPK